MLPRFLLFVAGVACLLGSFKLFDRVLPDLHAKEGPVSLAGQIAYRPWAMFLIGLAVTALTLSVSVSLSLLVPLAAKGYVRRENVCPYILGANITTFIDTLFAGALVGHPDAVRIVAVLMTCVTALSVPGRAPGPLCLRAAGGPGGAAGHPQHAVARALRDGAPARPRPPDRPLTLESAMDCLVYVDPSQRGEWVLTLAAQLPRAYAVADGAARPPRRTRPWRPGCWPGRGPPGRHGRALLVERVGAPGPPSAPSWRSRPRTPTAS